MSEIGPSTGRPLDGVLGRIEEHTGHAVEQLPHVYRGRCPLHPEDGPMLLIRELSGGGVVLDCAAGCSARVVAESLGLEFRDLFPGLEQAQVSAL